MTEQPETDFLFALFELQRVIRLYADKEAAQYGTTRAQWAVLAKLARSEGLKQAELAEMMDIQPISLTRLIDRLCEAGLIERRPDAHDRRANRLYLLPAAQPILAELAKRRSEIVSMALDGLPPDDAQKLVAQLDHIKENVRKAIQAYGSSERTKEIANG